MLSLFKFHISNAKVIGPNPITYLNTHLYLSGRKRREGSWFSHFHLILSFVFGETNVHVCMPKLPLGFRWCLSIWVNTLSLNKCVHVSGWVYNEWMALSLHKYFHIYNVVVSKFHHSVRSWTEHLKHDIASNPQLMALASAALEEPQGIHMIGWELDEWMNLFLHNLALNIIFVYFPVHMYLK